MVLLCETLLNSCLYVRFVDRDSGSASGFILSNNAYQQLNVTTFDRMLAPLAAYNPDITVFEVYHCAVEQKWSTKLTNQIIIQSTNYGVRRFILHIVKDTWTCRLKDIETFYLRITPLSLHKILAKHGRGMNISDVIMLLLCLPYFWKINTCVLEYINTMEDVQKKALWSGIPFSDELLAAFATHSLLAAKSFPKDRPEWNGKPATEQTWKKWTRYFGPLHFALEWVTKELTVRGGIFGTAAAAITIHGISPSDQISGSDMGTGRGGLAQTIIEQFYVHFYSLASAATDSNVVLRRLTAFTTTQYDEITKILGKISNNPTNATRGTSNCPIDTTGTPPPPCARTTGTCALALSWDEKDKLNRRITQLKAELQGKWAAGRLCYTYRHGVSEGHTSFTWN